MLWITRIHVSFRIGKHWLLDVIYNLSGWQDVCFSCSKWDIRQYLICLTASYKDEKQENNLEKRPKIL